MQYNNDQDLKKGELDGDNDSANLVKEQPKAAGVIDKVTESNSSQEGDTKEVATTDTNLRNGDNAENNDGNNAVVTPQKKQNASDSPMVLNTDQQVVNQTIEAQKLRDNTVTEKIHVNAEEENNSEIPGKKNETHSKRSVTVHGHCRQSNRLQELDKARRKDNALASGANTGRST